MALLGAAEQVGQRSELPCPARQDGGPSLERVWQLIARWIQLRVLREDRVLERAQLGTGLDPDLFDQGAAGAAVGLECVGLATAAVEREHQLRAQVLAKRLLGDGGLQLRDQVGVAAKRQLRLDACLEGDPAPLLQPRDLRLSEVLVRQVRERGPAP